MVRTGGTWPITSKARVILNGGHSRTIVPIEIKDGSGIVPDGKNGEQLSNDVVAGIWDPGIIVQQSFTLT